MIKKISKLVIRSQLTKFGIVGFLGYLVDATVTVLLSLFLNPFIARIPAFILAASTTWALNRVYTFGVNTSRYSSVRTEFVHYFGLMLAGLVINYSVYSVWVLLAEDFAGKLLVGVALGSLSGMIVNFLLSKKIIYKN